MFSLRNSFFPVSPDFSQNRKQDKREKNRKIIIFLYYIEIFYGR